MSIPSKAAIGAATLSRGKSPAVRLTPNPWLPGSFDVARQEEITRHCPDIALDLANQAERRGKDVATLSASPTHSVGAKQSAMLSPTAANSIPATVNENPWDSKSLNRTRQAEILKSNPGLAKALKSAAAEPNPWLPATLNRTRQAEIIRTDPAKARALKAAAQAGA